MCRSTQPLCCLSLACILILSSCCVLRAHGGADAQQQRRGGDEEAEESCASCGFRDPSEPSAVDVNADFLEAVKRHILQRLQMRERPNISHPIIPKAAMVTALRRLHAGKVREDGRVEIPSFDGHGAAASYSNEIQEESSEIISFAESGGDKKSPESNFITKALHTHCTLTGPPHRQTTHPPTHPPPAPPLDARCTA
ncbi:hypothetical protein CRUP_018950 [Coryphaenoides rupestris]|nr:hypothetical protein CRUP_018950 [Coryphaenoides rupestris]